MLPVFVLLVVVLFGSRAALVVVARALATHNRIGRAYSFWHAGARADSCSY